MWSDSAITRFMSCSTTSITRSGRINSRSFFISWCVSPWFNPAAGSSSIRTFGRKTIARAISSSFWLPYDKSPANCPAYRSKSKRSSSSMQRANR
jgi:hypothetical protein